MIQIPANTGARKLGHKDGETINIGNMRFTWKAKGADTALAFAMYEMPLAPGEGLPVHLHPYAEVFYVLEGQVDFARDNNGEQEWVRCGPGEVMIVPLNALHAFHNRTDKPARFLSISTCYHEAYFNDAGTAAGFDDPVPSTIDPASYQKLLERAAQYQLVFPSLLGLSTEEMGAAVGKYFAERNRNLTLPNTSQA